MSNHDSRKKPSETKATLSVGGQDLTEEQAATLTAINDFIERLGIERARRAIEALDTLKKTA